MNKLLTDSIRVSNQWLVGLSGLISSFNYYKMGRLVAPLGMCLAIGGVGGSWLIPDLTAGKISLKSYIGYFGIAVLALGIILFRETTKGGQAKRKKAKEAAAAFEKEAKKGGDSKQGVKVLQGSWTIMSVALGVVVASALRRPYPRGRLFRHGNGSKGEQIRISNGSMGYCFLSDDGGIAACDGFRK